MANDILSSSTGDQPGVPRQTEEGIIQSPAELTGWWSMTKYSEGQSSTWNPPSAKKVAGESKEAYLGAVICLENSI